MRISDWSSDVCSSDLLTQAYQEICGAHFSPAEHPPATIGIKEGGAGGGISFGYCAKKGRGDGFVAGQLCNVTGGHVPAGARSSDWINSSAVIPCWREVLARSRYSRQAVILPSSRNSKTATSGTAVHLSLRQE